MVIIQFPDNNVKEFPNGTSAMDIAKSISEGRNIFSFFSGINHFKPLDERLRVINDPEPVVIFIKLTLFMKILYLVKNKFECI